MESPDGPELVEIVDLAPPEATHIASSSGSSALSPPSSRRTHVPITPTHPDSTWMRNMSSLFPHNLQQIGMTLREVWGILPYALRYVFGYLIPRMCQKKEAAIKIFGSDRCCNDPNLKGPMLGGIGSGGMIRSWLGEFTRWHFRPGWNENCVVPVDLFSIRYLPKENENEVGNEREASSMVLSANTNAADLAQRRRNVEGWNFMNSWATTFAPHVKGTFRGRFPFAWYEYEFPDRFRAILKQFSPIIPHNYDDSSTPVAIFRWEVTNLGAEQADISLMFSFQNGYGSHSNSIGIRPYQNINTERDPEECSSSGCYFAGIDMKNGGYRHDENTSGSGTCSKACCCCFCLFGCCCGGGACGAKRSPTFRDQCSFAIACGCPEEDQVSVLPSFRSSRRGDCNAVWRSFHQNGSLEGVGFEVEVDDRDSIAGAVCGKVSDVPPGESREIVFVLAWDQPLCRFSENAFWKKYTRFYGVDGNAAWPIVQRAFEKRFDWENEIELWQRAVLEDQATPPKYKRALFNELYYLVDGATVWVHGKESSLHADPEDDPLWRAEHEHFALIESHEYHMYDTYDVYVYASFTIMELWPELQKLVQRDTAWAILQEDRTMRTFGSGRDRRKIKYACPHDLGTGHEAPFDKVNSYAFQNVNRWKDLNCHYVVALYRDYVVLNDEELLRDCFPAATQALNYSKQFVNMETCLLENEDYPDQTYDQWSMSGVTAYCGHLWLCALKCHIAMCKALLLDQSEYADNERMLEVGTENFERMMWVDEPDGGGYYRFSSQEGEEKSLSIHSDAFFGHIFLRAAGLEPILREDRIKKGLTKIFQTNMRVGQGRNGMRPDGTLELDNVQSREIWTGVNYLFAATLMFEQMDEECFFTIDQVFTNCWDRFGYWYNTPEAYVPTGEARAICYCRPLSIWSSQFALEMMRKRGTRSVDDRYDDRYDDEEEEEGEFYQVDDSRLVVVEVDSVATDEEEEEEEEEGEEVRGDDFEVDYDEGEEEEEEEGEGSD